MQKRTKEYCRHELWQSRKTIYQTLSEKLSCICHESPGGIREEAILHKQLASYAVKPCLQKCADCNDYVRKIHFILWFMQTMKIFLQRKFPALWYTVPCTEKCPTPEYSVGDIVELAHKQGMFRQEHKQ